MKAALPQSAECPKRIKNWARRNSASRLPLDLDGSSSRGLQPVAYPADFRLASFHNHMSQFSKINPYLYIYLSTHTYMYIFCCFCFSKEDWLSHFSFLGLFLSCSDSLFSRKHRTTKDVWDERIIWQERYFSKLTQTAVQKMDQKKTDWNRLEQ